MYKTQGFMLHTSLCNEDFAETEKNGELAFIAVCNKLLKQVFAVVNNQTMFKNNYLKNTY